MTVLKHTNISIRIPSDHAALVIDAAGASKTLLSRWAADRLVKVAAGELGVPLPAPAAPTRDRLRAAARAAGMSEEAFRAKALADAVAATMADATGKVGESATTLTVAGQTKHVYVKKPSESGEFRIGRIPGSGEGPETRIRSDRAEPQTPAAAVRAAIGGN